MSKRNRNMASCAVCGRKVTTGLDGEGACLICRLKKIDNEEKPIEPVIQNFPFDEVQTLKNKINEEQK